MRNLVGCGLSAAGSPRLCVLRPLVPEQLSHGLGTSVHAQFTYKGRGLRSAEIKVVDAFTRFSNSEVDIDPEIPAGQLPFLGSGGLGRDRGGLLG